MNKIIDIKEYQSYPAISYSRLAKVARDPYLLVKDPGEETQAMIFGNVIDCLLTRPEQFNDIYLICDAELPDKKTTKLEEFIHTIWIMQDMSSEALETAYNSLGKTRITFNKIIEDFEPWKEKFLKLQEAKTTGKTVISTKTYDDALKVVNTLLTHEWSSEYFQKTRDVEIFYQIPIIFEMGGRAYKDLPDLIVVNHRKKTVTSIDIKHTEKLFDFLKSFRDFRYDIQAHLHTNGAYAFRDIKYPGYSVDKTFFLVASKNYPGKVLKYYGVFRKEAYKDVFGNTIKTVKELTEDLEWHNTMGVYEKREIYENNGFIEINL